MKPVANRYSPHQWVMLCLAILLGLQGTARASPLESVPESTQAFPATTPTTPDNTPPAAPSLKKPKLLPPARLTEEDPLVPLDQLVVKQQKLLAPYVPFVQHIDVAVDYGRLAMSLCIPKEHRYAGSLNILFRKNIQLSGTLGYSHLVPTAVYGNQNNYKVTGPYGSLGLAYFIKYSLYNNLYTGVCYGRSYFEISTVPTAISKTLTAAWWELMLGSEHQLFDHLNLYAGFTLYLKGLGNFEAFVPATNYMVPGYGRSVQAVVPSISLYIKYKISFLEKQISFKEPLAP